jgi:hypothetical protein
LLESVNLQPLDTLANFGVSPFTKVPVDEATQVIWNKFHNHAALAERSVEVITELMEVCLRTTYFQVDDNLFQQNDSIVKGSSLSPIVRNIYMENYEKLTLESAQHKPLLWLRYADGTFMIPSRGPERLQNILGHFHSLRPSIQFDMAIESESVIPFLDVLVFWRMTTLAIRDLQTTQLHLPISHLQI